MAFAPGYDLNEAIDLLRLAYAVDTPIDPGAPVGQPLIPAAVDEALLNPLSRPLIQNGWQAMPGALWQNSIAGSLMLNRCLLLRRQVGAKWQYCLSFRGTANVPNVLEDAGSQATITAGPYTFPGFNLFDALHLPKVPILDKLGIPPIKSDWNYTNGKLATDARAHVCFGFRFALESLDFKTRAMTELEPVLQALEFILDKGWLPEPQSKLLRQLLAVLAGPSLSQLLAAIPEDNPEIYVTGHSLGAAMAQLAAAWLAAGGLGDGKTPSVKLYAFAAPKPGEEYLMYSANNTLGPGMAFVVNNNLDSVPQVGLTVELPRDLVSTGVEQILQLPPKVIAALNNLSLGCPMNLNHIGAPVILNGQLPIEFDTTADVPGYYFANQQPVPFMQMPMIDGDAKKASLIAAVWQHMPWVYMDIIKSS